MLSRRISLAALSLVLLLFAGLCCESPARAAGTWGELREAARNLNVRAARDYKSAHVLTLKQGQRVRVDFLQDGWYAVFRPDAPKRDLQAALGYCKAKYLTPVPEPRASATAPVQTAAPKAGNAAPGASAAQPATPTAQPAAAPAAARGNIAPAKPTSVAPERLPVEPAPGEKQKVVAAVEQRPEDLPQKATAPGKPPVRITADKLTYDDPQRTVSFSGNVVAVHADLKLWADKLTAYFDKQGAPGEQIDRIVASGKVRVQRASTEGTCGSVTYLVKENLLLMEDDPVIRDGKNQVTGKVIKYYVKENRSEVVGGKDKRVEAILFAPETLEAP